MSKEENNKLIDFVENRITVFTDNDSFLYKKGIELPGHHWIKEKSTFVFGKEMVDSVLNTFSFLPISKAFSDYHTDLKMKELKNSLNNRNIIAGLDLEAPINGRILFKHQKETIPKLLNAKRSILAHDPRCGKTMTSLVALKQTGLPIHVVAPRSLHEVWRRESAALNIPIKEIHSSAKIGIAPIGDFALIVEECHMYNNSTAKRTINLIEFAHGASYIVLISGTPLKNGRPSNLFPLLTIIKHPLAVSRRNYEQTFCNAKKTKYSKWDASGASNLDVLYENTRDVIFRVRLEDCVDMPPKIRSLINAEITPIAAAIFKDTFELLRDKWNKRVVNNLISDKNEKQVIFTQLRHACSWAKLHHATLLAKEFKANNKKAVFFTAFVDSANALQEELSYIGNTGILVGGMTEKDRNESIDTFQTGSTDFIVATLWSGGEGIELSAASHIVLLDRPWTSALCIQAERRADSIAAPKTIAVDWLQCHRIDVRVDDIIIKKQENISEILTGDKQTEAFDFDIREAAEEILNEIFT